MQTAVFLLAIAGALAVVYRLVRALARLVLSFAEVTSASGLAEVSARRGDLTAMAEQRVHERLARRRQWGDLLYVLLWLGWLLLPPLISLAQPFYAAAAPLWLLPYRRVRGRAHRS